MKEEPKVMIIIPTCSNSRIPMLIRTVETIQAGEYKNVHVVVVADGNPDILETVGTYFENKESDNIVIIANEKRMDWVFSINRVLREFDSDYYIFGSDDLEFPPDCIKCAMARMQQCFPDGFGVVSIGKKNRTVFGLFGRKWADHFPNRQVFCPDFIHYAGDSELMRAVRALGKYAFPPKRDSSVTHHRLKDETRQLARAVWGRDKRTFLERIERGWIWGIDFNLIGRK